jgi:hypothetical protein
MLLLCILVGAISPPPARQIFIEQQPPEFFLKFLLSNYSF